MSEDDYDKSPWPGVIGGIIVWSMMLFLVLNGIFGHPKSTTNDPSHPAPYAHEVKSGTECSSDAWGGTC